MKGAKPYFSTVLQDVPEHYWKVNWRLLPPPAKIFGPPAETFVARRFIQGRLLVIYIAGIVLFIIISQFYEERWPSRLKALAC